MNVRDYVIAKQAGDYVNAVYTPPVRSKTPGKIWGDGHADWHTQFNAKFADLIRADEREACAKVCDCAVGDEHPDDIHSDRQWTALTLAAEIRARGNT